MVTSQRQIIEQAINQTSKELEGPALLRSFLLGSGIGAGGAGLLALAKTLRKARGASNTYTLPMDVPVYAKSDPEESKRAAEPAADMAEGLSEARTSLPRLWSALRSQPNGTLKALLAGGVGMGAGYWAGNRVVDTSASLSRQAQLDSAREEFEQALQELAAPADQLPKKRRRRASSRTKRASGPVSDKMLRLADNCQKLAAWPTVVPDGLKELLVAYAALSPMVGAYYGFNNRWDKRNKLSLEHAERQVNRAREQQNPTFPVATLVDSQSKKPSKSDSRLEPEPGDENDAKQKARDDVRELLNSEFAYLE